MTQINIDLNKLSVEQLKAILPLLETAAQTAERPTKEITKMVLQTKTPIIHPMQKWTKQDKTLLKSMINEGRTLQDMQNELGRTRDSIKGQIYTLFGGLRTTPENTIIVFKKKNRDEQSTKKRVVKNRRWFNYKSSRIKQIMIKQKVDYYTASRIFETEDAKRKKAKQNTTAVSDWDTITFSVIGEDEKQLLYTALKNSLMQDDPIKYENTAPLLNLDKKGWGIFLSEFAVQIPQISRIFAVKPDTFKIINIEGNQHIKIKRQTE